jgi:hypothetical protein
MISHKVPAFRSDIQHDKYVSAILDILDEEIALQTPNQAAEDPTDELDMLVADFLKHLTAAPDGQ